MTSAPEVAVLEARWIASPAALAEVVAALRDASRYAVDTEFMRQGPQTPEPALVQLAWPGGLALVDPLAVDVGPLARIFEGPGTACGHALAQDLEILEARVGRPPARIFDTQVAAAFLGYRQVGLGDLLGAYLGLPLDKGARRSDWLRRPLSAAQRAYAAADVRDLLPLDAALRAALRAAGRLAWAEEDCERLRVEGLSRPGPADAVAPDGLIAAVRALADNLELPAPLLATRADLAWWIQGTPPDRLVRGWRRPLLEPLLLAWESGPGAPDAG